MNCIRGILTWVKTPMVTQWKLDGEDLIDKVEHESCCMLRL